MKELKQLQQEDLARRRQMVARMPPQLVELPYKRGEMKDDWQRELEFAFEDMYNADRSKIFLVNFQQCFETFWWENTFVLKQFLFWNEFSVWKRLSYFRL